MITLSTIIAMSLTSPAIAQANDTVIDPVIQAIPTTEMVVATTALLPTTEVPVATTEVSVEVLADAAAVETISGTPIDWDADGGTTVTATEAPAQPQGSDVGLVMLPLVAALFAGAWFFRKKVFSAVAANKNEDPISIVSRKTIAGQASVVLVDVMTTDGTTRRLLLGSGDKGVSLVADMSPMDSIFPEAPELLDARIEPQVAAEPIKNITPTTHTPATVARFSNQLMDQNQSEAMESRSNTGSEMPRFRKRSGGAPPLLAADIETTTADEKRRAAQAVLDEVLAERKNDRSRGSRIRATA